MTWVKKLPARHNHVVEVGVHDSTGVSLKVVCDDGRQHLVSLTLNQAGDLAHTLEEAVRKAQEAPDDPVATSSPGWASAR